MGEASRGGELQVAVQPPYGARRVVASDSDAAAAAARRVTAVGGAGGGDCVCERPGGSAAELQLDTSELTR